MIRAVLLLFLCVVLATLSSTARAATPDHTLLLAQLPPPGPPGPPGPNWPGAPPGWPGPAPGPQWLEQEQHCEVLTRQLARLRHGMRHAPPPAYEQFAVRARATEARLRGECWGP